MNTGGKRKEWYKEGALALFTGFLYGGTNSVVGHPFDTVKTKMQAQDAHMASKQAKPGMIQTCSRVFTNEGLIGFYRGWIPPFIGSVVYRSVQFSVYESIFTYYDKNMGMKEAIPYTGGLEYRVLLAALTSGSIRSFIECPFEYAKVKRQTGQTWVLKDIYKGLTNLYPRTTFMMTTYFLFVDTMRRKTNLWDYNFGKFLVSGGGAALGFIIMWPMEVLKNLAQAENKLAGDTTGQRARYIMTNQGVAGFYRGIVPGVQSVFLRNGAAMIVMQYANKKIAEKGWRE